MSSPFMSSRVPAPVCLNGSDSRKKKKIQPPTKVSGYNKFARKSRRPSSVHRSDYVTSGRVSRRSLSGDRDVSAEGLRRPWGSSSVAPRTCAAPTGRSRSRGPRRKAPDGAERLVIPTGDEKQEQFSNSAEISSIDSITYTPAFNARVPCSTPDQSLVARKSSKELRDGPEWLRRLQVPLYGDVNSESLVAGGGNSESLVVGGAYSESQAASPQQTTQAVDNLLAAQLLETGDALVSSVSMQQALVLTQRSGLGREPEQQKRVMQYYSELLQRESERRSRLREERKMRKNVEEREKIRKDVEEREKIREDVEEREKIKEDVETREEVKEKMNINSSKEENNTEKKTDTKEGEVLSHSAEEAERTEAGASSIAKRKVREEGGAAVRQRRQQRQEDKQELEDERSLERNQQPNTSVAELRPQEQCTTCDEATRRQHSVRRRSLSRGKVSSAARRRSTSVPRVDRPRDKSRDAAAVCVPCGQEGDDVQGESAACDDERDVSREEAGFSLYSDSVESQLVASEARQQRELRPSQSKAEELLPPGLQTLNYLIKEIQCLIEDNKGSSELSRLLTAVSDTVRMLPAVRGTRRRQLELDLALQPYRVEAAALRRQLRLCRQQLKDTKQQLQRLKEEQPLDAFEAARLRASAAQIEEECACARSSAEAARAEASQQLSELHSLTLQVSVEQQRAVQTEQQLLRERSDWSAEKTRLSAHITSLEAELVQERNRCDRKQLQQLLLARDAELDALKRSIRERVSSSAGDALLTAPNDDPPNAVATEGRRPLTQAALADHDQRTLEHLTPEIQRLSALGADKALPKATAPAVAAPAIQSVPLPVDLPVDLPDVQDAPCAQPPLQPTAAAHSAIQVNAHQGPSACAAKPTSHPQCDVIGREESLVSGVSRFSVTDYFGKYPSAAHTTTKAAPERRTNGIAEFAARGTSRLTAGCGTELTSVAETDFTVTSADERGFEQGLADLDASIERLQKALRSGSDVSGSSVL